MEDLVNSGPHTANTVARNGTLWFHGTPRGTISVPSPSWESMQYILNLKPHPFYSNKSNNNYPQHKKHWPT